MSAPKFKRNAPVTRALVILIVLFTLFTSFQIIYYYGSKISGEILKGIIEEQTSGSYQLNYGKLAIRYRYRTLEIQDLILSPIPDRNNPSEHLYEVKVPSLKLKVNSIFDIYLNRDLKIKHIAIVNPQISMRRVKEDIINPSLSLETGDLFSLINSYLEKFSIDSLGLERGELKYQSSLKDEEMKILFNNISLYIDQFLIDSESDNSENFLNTENIELILTDQHFKLADSLHFISFDTLRVSTKSGRIHFTNINLDQNLGSINWEIKDLNKYHITLPKLEFKGVDFARAYQKNQLFIDSAKIEHPNVRVTKNNTSSKVQSNDIGPLLLGLFGSIQINTIIVNEGKGEFNSTRSNTDQALKSGMASLIIDHFHLDSTNYDQSNLTRLYDNFEILLTDQRFVFPDSSHTIEVGKLTLNTKTSRLFLKETQIYPLKTKTDLSKWAEGQIAEIEILGFSLNTFIETDKLDLEEVILNNPTLDIHISENKGSFQNSFPLKINHFGIQNGTLQLYTDQASIKAQRLTLSIKSYDNKMPLLQSKIRITKLIADLLEYASPTNTYLVNAINATKNFENTKIGSFEMTSNANKNRLKTASISISGLNLEEYILNEKILFDSVTLNQPEIHLELLAPHDNQNKNNWINKTHFSYIAINNGRAKITNEEHLIGNLRGVNFQLSDFDYDSVNEMVSQNLFAQIDSIDFLPPNLNHKVALQKVIIDEEKRTIQTQAFSINPNKSKLQENNYKTSGNINLSGVDFSTLYKYQKLHFDSGWLNCQRLNVQIVNENSSNSVLTDIIRFNHLASNYGQVNVTTPKLGLSTRNLDLAITGFELGSDKLFLANNYIINANITSLKWKGDQDSLRFSSLIGNTQSGDFEVVSLSLDNLPQWHFDIPKINVTSLDLISLVDHKGIVAKTLNIDQPNIDIYLSSNSSQPARVIPNFQLEELNVRNSEISIKNNKIVNQDSLYLHGINVSLTKIKLDETFSLNSISRSYETINARGTDLSYILPDSLFRIRIKSYQYDSRLKGLVFDKVRLEPLYNRGAFQSKIKYQQDWFDGLINKVEILGFEMDSLLSGDKLISSHINILQLDLDTHRDKRIPREENIYKALPQTLIRQVSIPIAIDTIYFFDSYVSHSEFAEKGELPGSIYFKSIEGTLSNVTNDPIKLTENHNMEFRAKGSLMNTGDFFIQVKFDLTDPKDSYRLRGYIGNMDLTEMNRFLEHTAFVHIRDGNSKSVSFNFSADNDYAMGEMEFNYDNLKISVLNEDTYQTKGLGVSMKTFFANTFVVNSKNPNFLFLRDGDIFYERDQSKSVFNYWGKALLSGVVSSIGAKNNKKEIKEKNEQIRKELENDLPD